MPMHRRRLLGLALTAWLPVLAVRADDLYRDYLMGFEFAPPTGWQLQESPKQLGQVSLLLPAAKAAIAIAVEPRPGQRDDGKPATRAQLDQISQFYRRKLARSPLGRLYRDFQPLDAAPGLIGSFQSAQVLYQALPRSTVPEGRVLLCLGGDRDRLVTVTLVAPPQRLDVLQRSLAQMLRSFRLF